MTDATQEYSSPPRPIERIELAKSAARNNFKRKLITQVGLSEPVAAEIARIVVHPDQARLQLDYVQRRRFPGGTATLLVTDVFTPAVSVSPVNPRETERRIFPLEFRSGTDLKPPLRLGPRRDEPVLVVTGEDPDHVAWTIQQSANDLKNNSNKKLREPIWLDGVREPLLIFPAEFRHEDGSPPVLCAMAADGSSRTAWCHEFAGFDSVDVVYKWAIADARAWRGKLGEILAVQELPAGQASDDELAAHRCLIAPAEIVLRIEAVRGGDPVDSVEAYRSMVGAIHVSAPEPWGRGAENDEIGNAVLDQLVEDGHVDEIERDYLAGFVPPDDAESLGFTRHPDVRAARLMEVINADHTRSSVSKAYCSIRQQRRLRRNDRPDIAAELALRACRLEIASQMKGRRSALERAFRLSEWRGGSLSVSGRNPEELRDAALDALATDPDVLSGAALELGLYGAYWLTTAGALRRETSRSKSKLGVDRVLELMMRSRRGVHQLYQVVVEGRRGERRFSVVNEDGSVFRTEAGDGRAVTDDFLRETFNLEADDGPNGDEGDGDGSDAAVAAPRERLRRLILQLSRDVDRVEERIRELRFITMNGEALVEVEGIPHGTATRLTRALREIENELSYWARVNRRHRRVNADAADVLDDHDMFADDEVVA